MTTALARLTEALSDRYRVERELGQGGMAMVYLALDLRHERHVAIKVLRPELAAVIGAERFLREIKTIATLQHSHILGLIDSGEVNGTAYYVMPYVDGESLRDRLDREKQLPVADAVRIATEVASALDYAHRHGVIHRDIKPENVLLHDGTALVADFGIALAASNAGATRMTETGMSLGTPHYMSPEQAMGEREITARSDIYALGAITYEMLVGEPPFTGPTAQAIVAKVMTEEPRPLIPKRRTIPQAVETAVLIALQKVPADRFGSAADFAGALTGRIVTTAIGSSAAAGVSRKPFDWRVAGAIAAISVLVGIAASQFLLARAPEPARLGQFAIQIHPVRSVATGFSRQIAISADGGTVGFVGRGPRGTQVYLRSMADTTARPVAGTEGAQSLFFSPDSRQIGFWLSTQRLMRIPVEGGTPIVVADSAGSFGSWNDDGSVIYTDPIGRELRLALPDGTIRRVLRSDSSVFLGVSSVPGSRTILATQLTGGRTQMRVVGVSLSDGTIQDIGLTDVLMAKALREGYLIYQRRAGGPLIAVAFDFKRLKMIGEGHTVSPATRVTYRVVPQWDASGSALVFFPPAPMQLVLVDRAGRTTPLEDEPRTYHHPRFSPDGRLLALDITDQGRDVWLVDTRDRRMWRLTVGEIANDPFWSPDGQRIAYTAVRGGVRGIFFRAADGSGTPDSIYMDQNDHSSGGWAPDGSALVVSTAGQSGLWRIPLDAPGSAARIPGSRASEAYPALSRDGRWLAYVSDESGRQEVYVRPFVGSGGRIQVSVNGGSEPVFTRDGQELIYEEHGETSQLIAARIRTAPTFEVLSRTTLFDVTNYANAEDHANYDVSPDGRSFAMIRNAQASQIQLILNWVTQLGR